jgi:hypothetical protein
MPRLDRGILFRGREEVCPVKPGNDERWNVLSRKAGEDGTPAKPGEVRDRKSGACHPLISPLRCALLLPLKEREKT